jgi:hypothetical protein
METTILTIGQKKIKVHCLSREFLSSSDAGGLTYLKNDILQEITSCGFNAVSIEIKRLAELALLGLLHLIDLSELATQTIGVQQRA